MILYCLSVNPETGKYVAFSDKDHVIIGYSQEQAIAGWVETFGTIDEVKKDGIKIEVIET